MSKVLAVILCVLMLCAVLSGCGKNKVSDMASEAVSEVITGTDGAVTDGDGFIGDETKTETENSTINNNENSNNTDNNNSSILEEDATTVDSTEPMM